MLVACAIAVLSVLLGAAVGFSRRIGDRHLGPVRTFAFAAALAVVFGQFLPDAFEGIGIAAAVPFAIGVCGPWLLERLTARASKSSRSLGLEIGYAGLLIHQLGDGIGMGTYTGPHHDGHRHIDLFLAIGGHTVPVAAMVVVAFLRAKGPRAALIRAFGLALFVVLGVAAARFFSVSLVERHHAAISALVAGLLLHIATDDLRAHRPQGARDRALDLFAGAAGLVVVLAMSTGHEHEPEATPGAACLYDSVSPLHLFASSALRVAPFVLAGLLAWAVIRAVAQKAMASSDERSRQANPSVLKQAALGLAFGVSSPFLGWDASSPRRSILRRTNAPALVSVFLLVGTALGADTLLVSTQAWGIDVAGLRLATTVVAALLGGASLALLVIRRGSNEASEHQQQAHAEAAAHDDHAEGLHGAPHRHEPAALAAARYLDELTYHAVPWMLVGLFAASYVSASGALLTQSLPPSLLDFLVFAMLAALTSASPLGATPLAAALIAAGVMPALVFAALVSGAMIRPAALTFLGRSYGWVTVMAACAVVLGVALGGAMLIGAHPLGALTSLDDGKPASILSYLAAGALLILALGASYRRGVRGFFASLFDPFGRGESSSHHAHGEDDPFHAHDGSPAEVELGS